jgi:hypothetical protein
MTEEEEETFEELLLVMPDSVPASPFLLLLERRFPLEAGMTDEEEEDDTLSSFADVPLSSPHATRAMDRKIASRDCFAAFSMTLFKPTITLFIPNFLILYSFFSSMCNFHTLQTSSIFIQQQSRKKSPCGEAGSGNFFTRSFAEFTPDLFRGSG